VDPVPDPLLLRKSNSAGDQTQTSGSVARNSDHKTTEAVQHTCHNILYHLCLILAYAPFALQFAEHEYYPLLHWHNRLNFLSLIELLHHFTTDDLQFTVNECDSSTQIS
jgi:hypothetical protein